MSCLFCKGQKIPAEGFSGNGIHTMKQNLDLLFGSSKESEPSDYIQLGQDSEENFLLFQNSSDEYAEGRVAIHYCPLCGRDLDTIGKEAKSET